MQSLRCLALLLVSCFVCAGLLPHGLLAQDDSGYYFENYDPLVAEAPIPQDFLRRFQQQYERQRERSLAGAERRRERKQREQFAARSSYFLDQLLQNGKVLFNDRVSKYINDVADQVLADKPGLRQALRFYALQSPAVNAFATDQGIIFITLGMMAQLENEAQLAYIICHEIVHYQEKHNMDRFLALKDIEKAQDGYRGLSFEEKLLAKSNYSREQELAADRKGLQLLKQTGYSLAEATQTLDVLLYSYLPFDIEPFDKRFFDSPHFTFGEPFWLAETQGITAIEDYADTLKSHPNIKKRRTVIKAQVSKLGGAQGAPFQLGRSQFQFVRTIARFELVRLNLMARDYERCIYNTFLLMQEHPDNTYLQHHLGMALYGLARYKLAGEFDAVHRDYETVEGPSQQVYYCMEQMSTERLVSLALRSVWQARRQGAPRQHTRQVARDLTAGLARLAIHYDDFAQAPPADTAGTRPPEADTTRPDKSKYDKLREQKARREASQKAYQYALLPFRNDTSLAQVFEEGAASHQAQASEEATADDTWGTDDYEIERVAFLDPVNLEFQTNKEQPLRIFKTQRVGAELRARMRELGEKVDFQLAIENVKELQAQQVERFNTIARANAFLRERLRHQRVELVPMMPTDALRQALGTPHLGLGGLIHFQSPFDQYYMLLFPPLIPYVIYRAAFAPDHYFLFFSIVYDLQTGQLTFSYRQGLDRRPRRDILRSYVYDALLHIEQL